MIRDDDDVVWGVGVKRELTGRKLTKFTQELPSLPQRFTSHLLFFFSIIFDCYCFCCCLKWIRQSGKSLFQNHTLIRFLFFLFVSTLSRSCFFFSKKGKSVFECLLG